MLSERSKALVQEAVDRVTRWKTGTQIKCSCELHNGKRINYIPGDCDCVWEFGEWDDTCKVNHPCTIKECKSCLNGIRVVNIKLPQDWEFAIYELLK